MREGYKCFEACASANAPQTEISERRGIGEAVNTLARFNRGRWMFLKSETLSSIIYHLFGGCFGTFTQDLPCSQKARSTNQSALDGC